MPRSNTLAELDGADTSRNAPRVDSATSELERLIREQRADQKQDRTGLRSTVLGDVLRGVGVHLLDSLPRRSRLPNMDEQ
jgi:hypothetical protein